VHVLHVFRNQFFYVFDVYFLLLVVSSVGNISAIDFLKKTRLRNDLLGYVSNGTLNFTHSLSSCSKGSGRAL